MEQPNGQQDNLSRLDRIERAIECAFDEHEAFRAEHKALLRSQVLFQDALETQKVRMDEIGDKLNGLIGAVDSANREFHERLKRLEGI